jgi:hypothetical protein
VYVVLDTKLTAVVAVMTQVVSVPARIVPVFIGPATPGNLNDKSTPAQLSELDFTTGRRRRMCHMGLGEGEG